MRAERLAQMAEQRRAPLHADQRIVRRNLECRAQILGNDAQQRAGVSAQGLLQVRGKRSAREHVQAGDGEAFRSGQRCCAGVLHVAPGIAGAGVEQHARDREVDARARDGVTMALGVLLGERRPAIRAADLEVPPAAVKGNF